MQSSPRLTFATLDRPELNPFQLRTACRDWLTGINGAALLIGRLLSFLQTANSDTFLQLSVW